MKKTIIKPANLILYFIFAVLFLSCSKGEQGPAGKDGNANVIGTNEFTAFSHNWIQKSGGSKGTFYSLTVTSPPITDEVVDKGVVICYNKVADKTWFALPFDDYSFFIVPGGIGIIYDYNVNPGSQTFRIVAISPSELSKHPDIDLMNYEEVNAVFGLMEK